MIVLCDTYEGRYASLFSVYDGKVTEVAYALGQLHLASEYCQGDIYMRRKNDKRWGKQQTLTLCLAVTEEEVPKEILLYLLLIEG